MLHVTERKEKEIPNQCIIRLLSSEVLNFRNIPILPYENT